MATRNSQRDSQSASEWCYHVYEVVSQGPKRLRHIADEINLEIWYVFYKPALTRADTISVLAAVRVRRQRGDLRYPIKLTAVDHPFQTGSSHRIWYTINPRRKILFRKKT